MNEPLHRKTPNYIIATIAIAIVWILNRAMNENGEVFPGLPLFP